MKIGSVTLQPGKRLFLIAGPCVIEDREKTFRVARDVQKALKGLKIDWIFKASYDKANRSSGKSFRGLGIDEGLRILEGVRDEFGVPVLTDVHSEGQAVVTGKVVDVLQIPAFLCRQTDLLLAAAKTGKAVNVKKGQFLAPWDMKNVVDKIAGAGNPRVLLTERGVSFGYNTLVSDMRGIPVMKQWGKPVVFDATHSVQQPGGLGAASGGQREFVPTLARAATAAGADGLFMETHYNPDKAPSDGPNMVPTPQLRELVQSCIAVFDALKKFQ